MDSNLYWIWLSEALGPASDCFLDLLQQFKTAEGIYRAERDELEDITKLRPSVITSLLDKNLAQAQRILDRCESRGIGILPFSDALFPDRLRRIHRPPVLLYYRGFLPDFPNRLAIAVVGTRGMTEEGRKNGYRIAYELAIAGAVVVSGMAIGIDGIAHVGALDAGGTTVAVLGSAIDYPYPLEHRPIYEKLIRQGGVISEYPPGMRTQRWHFPQRNRIIAGLCQGTLIVEAGENSGALITAKDATCLPCPVMPPILPASAQTTSSRQVPSPLRRLPTFSVSINPCTNRCSDRKISKTPHIFPGMTTD